MTLEEYCEIIHNSHPRLMYCENFDESSEKWNFTRHSHPYIELIYFLEGRADLEAGGVKMRTTLYDTVVYPAGCMHLDGPSTERKREIICFWIDIPELVVPRPILLHGKGTILQTLFRMLYQEGRREALEEIHVPYQAEYMIKLLLIQIIREAIEYGQEEKNVSTVLTYIGDHFSEQITLDELAALEHISVSYLSRRFKEATGMTVITYVNHLRIRRAKELLIATGLSASEIAYQVGFDSPKYFHRVFKKETGEAPAAFRRAYTEKGRKDRTRVSISEK